MNIISCLFERIQSLREQIEQYASKFNITEMKKLEPMIKEMQNAYEECKFMERLCPDIISDNYQDVFESDYYGSQEDLTQENLNVFY